VGSSGAGSTEWSALVAFPIAAVVLVIVAAVYLLYRKERPNAPLEYLESTWSFTESWATNVTLAAGLISGIFGSSEVVTALAGENGKSSAALATVGAAVAASFIAAGTLIVLASKTKEEHLSVGGLLAASAVTLAGGFGEVWVLFRAGERLDLAGWQDAAGGIAAAAALLLTWYAVRSIPAVITNGKKEPTPEPSDALTAAKMIVEAIKAVPGVQTEHIDAAITAASALHPELQARKFDSPHTRRTALL
jgi:uncharacterized membrane protein